MSEKQCSWTLTARWVLPVAGPPLQRGVLTITGGRITALEPWGRRQADLDFGNAAILPGLVNAHTHLDLSGLRGRRPPTDNFTDWLRAVIRHRRGLARSQAEADIRAGWQEALGHGTTLLGDISSQGWSWPVLAGAPLRCVVFYELLGLPRPRARQAWTEARAWLQAHPRTETCRPGLSLHAPYSVRACLFRAAAALARRQAVPLATHVAETPAELELLQRRTGPLRQFLAGLGVWDAEGLLQSVDQLLRLYAGVEDVLLVHGNYLDADLPFQRQQTIVYCPRTHAAFGHSAHPLPALLKKGVRVVLGTDSLASNPDLDLLSEARFLHQIYREVPGEVVVRLATLAGAEALGWEHESGSLTPGKSADLIVLPLPAEEQDDPHRLVLESSACAEAVLFRGRWVHGEGTELSVTE